MRRANSRAVRFFVYIAISGALSVPTKATVLSYFDSIPTRTTNWTDTLDFPQFNPALGSLNSITFSMYAWVKGLAQFESLDASPTTVTLNLKADLRLTRPDGSQILRLFPLAAETASVTAFDGVIDFGGTSGRTYPDLTGSVTDAFVSPPPASDLALFTGTGTISLPIRATGMSSGQGSGNLIASFRTGAGAELTVSYDYTPLPEPASLALLLGGLLLLRRMGR